jgi:deoxyribodipyrimidine photolyase-like uncharacterized protein
VRLRTGSDACPFNPLFWSFLVEQRRTLEGLTDSPEEWRFDDDAC